MILLLPEGPHRPRGRLHREAVKGKGSVEDCFICELLLLQKPVPNPKPGWANFEVSNWCKQHKYELGRCLG